MTAWFLTLWTTVIGIDGAARTEWRAPKQAPFYDEASCHDFAIPYVRQYRYNGYRCEQRELER